MEVLISWSKPQSKTVAGCLRTWLPKVLPGLKPWISDKDIDKGKEWLDELQNKLDSTSFCVIVVTKENVASPWIYFEAGAISKGREGLICPYLVNIRPSELAGNPLTILRQCTEATRDDTWEMVKSINKALKKKHNEGLLEAGFEKHWPELDECITAIPIEVDEEVAVVVREAKLSPEGLELLIAGSADGRIAVSRTNYGLQIQAGRKAFVDRANPRSIAKYEEVLDELVQFELIRDTGYQGHVFALTPRGYEVVDAASGQQQTALTGKPLVSETKDVQAYLLDWFNRLPFNEKTVLIQFDAVDSQLGLEPGMAKKWLQPVVLSLEYELQHRGDTTIIFRPKPEPEERRWIRRP